MEPRFTSTSRNGEHWFRMNNQPGTQKDTVDQFRIATDWCAANVPPAYLVSVGGHSILILNPTYAAAFRMRWC